MASMRRYQQLEALFANAAPPVDEALEAQRSASRAARSAAIEAAHAKELAEQAALRGLVRETERVGLDPRRKEIA